MKLLALRCGDLYTDVSGLLVGQPTGVMGEVPVMCFLVDTGDGVLVFDTGLHRPAAVPTLPHTSDPCGRHSRSGALVTH